MELPRDVLKFQEGRWLTLAVSWPYARYADTKTLEDGIKALLQRSDRRFERLAVERGRD